MSNLNILAKSPSIIYRPGGVPGGLVVTSWAQVQKFIAARQGSVTVYVDDSVTSPALVPGATGVTDCEGRVEFRPFALDSINYSVLQVEDGATLANLMSVDGMELRCNCQSATPSLSWSDTANGPFLEFKNEAILSNASTATQPAIVVPAGKTWAFFAPTGFFIELNAPAVPLVSLPTATSALNINAYANSNIPAGFVSGVGILNVIYDNTTANELTNPFVFPPQAAFTGSTQLFPFGSNPQTLGSIIYRPGGASSGDVVATWPEVQALVKAYSNITANSAQGTTGKFILYVDDSVTSPALVPGATGLTDGFGRLEIRPYVEDPIRYTVLQVEPGATIANLYAVNGLELRSNAQTATPSLSFTIAPNGGLFYLLNGAVLSNAATATMPAIVVAAGKTVFIQLEDGSTFVPQAPAVPLVSASTATSNLTVIGYNANAIPDGYAAGPGNVTLLYDNVTAFFFPTPGTPPTLPGLTGTYTTTDIDFASSAGVTLGGDVQGPANANTIVKGIGSIIYRPGVASGADHVATWAEVQTLIASWDGKCVVFIDDSLVSPATVPGATGITDFLARGELRPFREDVENYATLVIEDGATLKGINKIAGTLAVFANTMSATPAFSWDYTAGAAGVPWPVLYLEDNAYIGTTATATNPAILVAAANPLNIVISGQGGVVQGAPAVSVISVANLALLQLFLYSAKLEAGPFSAPTFPISPAWVSGAGSVQIEYDSSTVALSAGIQNTNAATNTLIQLDTNLVEMTFSSFGVGNVLITLQDGPVAKLPKFGTLLLEIEGYGGSGGGGGGQAGGAANGVGGGGSGGCLLQRSFFSFNLADRLDIIVGAGGTPGAAGVAPAGNGGNGGDGGRSYALDFNTNVILAVLSGTSGGQGGGPSPGLGGATYPGGVLIPKLTEGIPAQPYGAGFMLAGGAGGAANTNGSAGQPGVSAQLIPGAGVNWQPGQGGISGAGEGGGGGGGGAGVVAPGGPGGDGQPAGTPGGNGGGGAPFSGAGVGGGAGGAGVTDNGGAGATGAMGFVKLRFLMP